AHPRRLGGHRPHLRRTRLHRSHEDPSMNAPGLITARETEQLSHNLLGYYEAIESASQDMLQAARTGDWDTVVKLEGACAVLIAQLKHASESRTLGRD